MDASKTLGNAGDAGGSRGAGLGSTPAASTTKPQQTRDLDSGLGRDLAGRRRGRPVYVGRDPYSYALNLIKCHTILPFTPLFSGRFRMTFLPSPHMDTVTAAGRKARIRRRAYSVKLLPTVEIELEKLRVAEGEKTTSRLINEALVVYLEPHMGKKAAADEQVQTYLRLARSRGK